MTTPTVRPRAAPRRTAPTRRPTPETPRTTRKPAPQPLDLDRIASRWQLALDAADRALTAAAASLPSTDLVQRHHELVSERQQTVALLAGVARDAGVRRAPWLSPIPVTARLLGLPNTVRACLFDLDGVLTDSGSLHARAWAEVFDGLLLHLSERAGWAFIPFDRDKDYRDYLDGRERLDGIHAFLDSRGIRLPEGRGDDPPDEATAWGLANRKGEAVRRLLRSVGVAALPGARRYLEAAGYAGLQRCVISASSSTRRMLELTGLAPVVDEHLDAEIVRVRSLRPRPAPDVLLHACSRIGIPAESAATFTTSPAGVAAGRAAGAAVIGVGSDRQRELLSGFGADRTAPSLDSLFDRRLFGDTR